MSQSRLFLCGGVSVPDGDSRRSNRKVVNLSTTGIDANINLIIEDLCKKFSENIDDRLTDLIEIATYVYAADCNTLRNSSLADVAGQRTWSRDFHFVIPVSDQPFWSIPEVKSKLTQLLRRLSNDCFAFDFVKSTSLKQRQTMFQLGDDEDWPFSNPDRVLLFSGGLDSLAGAVETASAGTNLVLVSHRTTATMHKKQRILLERLGKAFPCVKILHVPVSLTLTKKLKSGEPTQRTRSFLFAVLATVVARSTNAKGIRFFENGVISVNLPVADEVLGARASRTTHPRTLHDIREFMDSVTGSTLEVDNPFFWKTKKEIVEIVANSPDPELIGYSRSCADGRWASKTSWHCGSCSQCIDRRIAVIAANAEAYESESDYSIDVFTGPRLEGYHQNIALGYVRQAKDIFENGSDWVAEEYSDEIIEANRVLGGGQKTAQKLCELLFDHGKNVNEVVKKMFTQHAERLFLGNLPASSLLRLVAGNKHAIDNWVRLADKITQCLQDGLPAACSANMPKTEPDLQAICDGLLKSAGHNLEREFPYALWGLAGTKPDWSSEKSRLWIELKYIRKNSATPTKINDAIASDIVKYGDNGVRVLFVVYDPSRLIVNDARFVDPIEKHVGMRCSIIR